MALRRSRLLTRRERRSLAPVAIHVLEFVGLAIGVVGVAIAVSTLQDQQLTAAWQLLAIPSGNGKAYALQTLLQTEKSVSHLNLSCENMGGRIDPLAKAQCEGGPSLEGLELTAPSEGWEIRESKLEGVDFQFAKFTEIFFQNVSLDRSYFRGTKFLGGSLYGASFRKANLLQADFSGTAWTAVDLAGARLPLTDLSGVELPRPGRSINISGTFFCTTGTLCAQGVTQNFLDHAFFAPGDPPRGLAKLNPEFDVASCREKEVDEFLTTRTCDAPVKVSTFEPQSPSNN